MNSFVADDVLMMMMIALDFRVCKEGGGRGEMNGDYGRMVPPTMGKRFDWELGTRGLRTCHPFNKLFQ